MFTLLLAQLATVAAMPAFQALRPPCLVERAGFLPSRTGLAQLGLPIELMTAAPKLELLAADGSLLDACSATSVSDEGHLLTVGHCLEKCVEAAGLYRKEDGVSKVERERLIEATCRVRIDGQETRARVLAMSDCLWKGERQNAALADRCPHPDYALLKIENAQPRGCLAPGSGAPAPGTPVASVGHPMATFRRYYKAGALDAKGDAQAVSEGRVIEPSATCLKRVDRGSDERAGARKLPEPDASRALENVRRGDLIQTSGADAVKRSSGGPLVERATGRLLGISSFTFDENDAFTECEGATFYAPLTRIMERARRDFPSVDLEGAFRCARPIGGR